MSTDKLAEAIARKTCDLIEAHSSAWSETAIREWPATVPCKCGVKLWALNRATLTDVFVQHVVMEALAAAESAHRVPPLTEEVVAAINEGRKDAEEGRTESIESIRARLSEPCFTCEGENGLPATHMVKICSACAGDERVPDAQQVSADELIEQIIPIMEDAICDEFRKHDGKPRSEIVCKYVSRAVRALKGTLSLAPAALMEEIKEHAIVWLITPDSSALAGDGIWLERRDGFKGRRWAVTRRGCVLNKSGVWEFEPQPSSRTDEWLETVRWSDMQDAITAALRAGQRSSK